MRIVSPVSEMRKGQRSKGRVLAPNSRNKGNMAKHRNSNFRAYHTAVSLQLNGMVMMWKIQQAMQDDAIRIARIHPGNRAEVFIWQNFQRTYRDLGNHRASSLSHMNTSKFYKEFRGKAGNRKPGSYPSSKNPHFQNEARCTTFLVKISFMRMRMKNYFHIKG